MSDTTSLVKVFDSIVEKKIEAEKVKTTSRIVLYKSGSTLTPINLGKVSY